jgi:hypothetical protein
MNVITDELSQETLRLVVELLTDASEPVVSFPGCLQGITTGRLPVDQALHFIASCCEWPALAGDGGSKSAFIASLPQQE